MGLSLTRRRDESLVFIDLESRQTSELRLLAIADQVASFDLDGESIELILGQSITCRGFEVQLRRVAETRVVLWLVGEPWSECYRRELLDKFFATHCVDDEWLIAAVKRATNRKGAGWTQPQGEEGALLATDGHFSLATVS